MKEFVKKLIGIDDQSFKKEESVHTFINPLDHGLEQKSKFEKFFKECEEQLNNTSLNEWITENGDVLETLINGTYNNVNYYGFANYNSNFYHKDLKFPITCYTCGFMLPRSIVTSYIDEKLFIEFYKHDNYKQICFKWNAFENKRKEWKNDEKENTTDKFESIFSKYDPINKHVSKLKELITKYPAYTWKEVNTFETKYGTVRWLANENIDVKIKEVVYNEKTSYKYRDEYYEGRKLYDYGQTVFIDINSSTILFKQVECGSTNFAFKDLIRLWEAQKIIGDKIQLNNVLEDFQKMTF